MERDGGMVGGFGGGIGWIKTWIQFRKLNPRKKLQQLAGEESDGGEGRLSSDEMQHGDGKFRLKLDEIVPKIFKTELENAELS